jgi:hypothetical protein
MTQNYKLDNAYRAIQGVTKVTDMSVANIKVFTKLLQALEPVLVPYFDERRDETKKFTDKDAEGKFIITDQIALQEVVEELAKKEIEFTSEKFNITLKKGEKWFSIEFNKALEDLYGDNFNLVEVE